MQPRQGQAGWQQQRERAWRATYCVTWAHQGGAMTLHLEHVKRLSAPSWLLQVQRGDRWNQGRAVQPDQAVQQGPAHQANHWLVQAHGVFQWSVGQDRCPFQSVVPILQWVGDGVPKHDVGWIGFEMGKGRQSFIHDRFDTGGNIPM